MTVAQLLDELNELLRCSVVGPNTPVKIDRGVSEAVPLQKIDHVLQIQASPYLKLS